MSSEDALEAPTGYTYLVGASRLQAFQEWRSWRSLAPTGALENAPLLSF